MRIMAKISKKDTERFEKIWGKGGDMDKTVERIKKIIRKYGQ